MAGQRELLEDVSMRRIFSFLILSLVFNSGLALSTQTSAPGQMLAISDIHFSPFADCKTVKKCQLVMKLNQANADQWPQLFSEYSSHTLPTNGHPTNYALFHSLLVQIQQLQPENTLILGDFLAHRFRVQYLQYTHDHNRAHYENFVVKTLQYVTNSIQQVIPENSAIYPVVGNNDSYGGKDCSYPDYCIIPNGTFLQKTTNVWSVLFRNPTNKALFMADFPKAGYYEIILPNSHNHIIVLNTVLFSSKAQGPNVEQAAHAQLQWLQQKLQNIADAKEKTWIIFHIPPGIDAYSTAKNFLGIVVPFWNKENVQQFSNLIHQYNSSITAVLSGHTHMDGFLILDMKSSNRIIVDTFVPSISPIFGNNPAYKLYNYHDENFEIHDFITWYLNLHKDNGNEGWKKEYTFSTVYQTNDGLLNGYQKIIADKNSTFSTDYRNLFSINTQSQLINKNKWNFYWCATSCLSVNSYQSCLKNVKNS
jgi:sphingomyelin phosphodiesterase acid-like 3